MLYISSRERISRRTWRRREQNSCDFYVWKYYRYHGLHRKVERYLHINDATKLNALGGRVFRATKFRATMLCDARPLHFTTANGRPFYNSSIPQLLSLDQQSITNYNSHPSIDPPFIMAPPRLLRLHPLTPDQLPSHPNLSSAQSKDVALPSLPSFVEQILVEASQLIDHDLQDPNLFRSKGKRPSKPSVAEVEVLNWTRTTEIGHVGSGLSNDTSVKIGDATKVVENWFARRSLHDITEVSWEEFEMGLCDEHSKHEAEYTPP
jgi:hypothetical protein